MTFLDALSYYKTSRAIGDALGLSKGRVSQMKSDGGFSYPIQCVLEKDTGGKLIARREDEPSASQSAA